METKPGLTTWLTQACPGHSLACFRIGFGLLMMVAMLRLLANGWVNDFWQQPSFYFSYIPWIQPWAWMNLHVWLLAGIALLLALGWRIHLMAVLFAIGFTWLELCCKSTYLNHYYLVTVLAIWLALLPAGSQWSLDSKRRQRRGLPRQGIQRWHLLCLQLQIGLVWTCASVAKMQSDWLFEGLPLWFWLRRFDDLPLIGSLLATQSFAIVGSWAGMLYDVSIAWFLCWKRTRVLAFAAVLVFHLITALAFPIGIFPWLMILCSTIFFAPHWPLRWSKQQHSREATSTRANSTSASTIPLTRYVISLNAVVLLSLQLLLPFRHYFGERPHELLWHERGFRWGWRVMVMEKTGWLRYTIILEDGTQYVIDPASKLAPHQAKQITTQPDMILYFAHHIPELYKIDHIKSIYAQSWVSLNGRNPSRLIKPDVDLLKITIKIPINQWVTELPQD